MTWLWRGFEWSEGECRNKKERREEAVSAEAWTGATQAELRFLSSLPSGSTTAAPTGITSTSLPSYNLPSNNLHCLRMIFSKQKSDHIFPLHIKNLPNLPN